MTKEDLFYSGNFCLYLNHSKVEMHTYNSLLKNGNYSWFNHITRLKKKRLNIYMMMISKSPPANHHCQHIIGIFPRSSPWYQFCFSNKDTSLGILICFFQSPEGDSKDVLTEMGNMLTLFKIIKSAPIRVLTFFKFPSACMREVQNKIQWYQKRKICKIKLQCFTMRITSTELGFYPIYPTPPLRQDMTQGQFLSGV